MEKSLILFLLLSFLGTAWGQSDKWTTISYFYSKGPVSPEYQYNYNIIISNDRTGMLSYTKAGNTNNYNFKISKKELRNLDKELTNSQVLTVNPADMKSDQTTMGGPQRSMTITLWQDANLDARPQTIEVPNQVNAQYSAGVNALYDAVENLVPDSIWKQATGE